ncbi:hypothetical protein LTS18_002825 [Coniosporium uncinatum]|uniref:Uncharacterized protein n=1 Tax=Coniosporium uncinatum TaxID=93489 RepID=A0ACC3D7L4_9PEZI|nr:hypothetical protein LTS18_002825 [Coniosporium uncinatum]
MRRQAIELFSVLSAQVAHRRPATVCRSCWLQTTKQPAARFSSTSPRLRRHDLGAKPSLQGQENESLRAKPADVATTESASAADRDPSQIMRMEGSETFAATGSDVANVYEQAQTWDGLQWIGSRGWVEKTTREPIDFEAFTPRRKKTSPENIKASIEQALDDILGAEAPKDADEAVWHSVSLKDLGTRFAVVKRATQITGLRIADCDINKCTDANRLWHHMLDAAKPAPKKLVETHEFQQVLHGLPNVKIHQKRSGSIDKDKAVGRWKVIEQELLEKDLPVHGRIPSGASLASTFKGHSTRKEWKKAKRT